MLGVLQVHTSTEYDWEIHQEKTEPLPLLQLLRNWLPYCIQNWSVNCLTFAVMCISVTSIIYYLLSPHYWKINNERLLKRRLLLGLMTPNRGGSTGNCLLADYEMRLSSGLDNLKRVFEPIIVIFFSFSTNLNHLCGPRAHWTINSNHNHWYLSQWQSLLLLLSYSWMLVFCTNISLSNSHGNSSLGWTEDVLPL